MMRALTILLAAVTCVGRSSAGDGPPRIVIQPAAGAIAIDGDLGDPGWRGAARLPELVYRNSHEPFRLKTEVALAYDRDNLYVGVTAFRPGADKLRYRKQKGKDTYGGAPVFEMWVDTSDLTDAAFRDAFQLAANAAGARYDALLRGGAGAWDGKWRSAGKVHSDRWTVEVALPFRDIGLSGPPVGRPIRANFGRYSTAFVSWTGGWGETDRLGLVFFANDAKYRPDAAKRVPKDTKPHTYSVDPKGDDANDGFRKPFRTVQRAVDKAPPGSTIIVRPGLYRERVVVTGGGAPGKPLTIRGEAGAILHGGDAAKGWERVGAGLYKKSGFPYRPMHMTWDGRFVLFTRKHKKTAARYLFGKPTPEDWEGIEVAFTSEGDTAWVRSRTGANPDDHAVTVCPAHHEGGATVLIRDARHVVLRGLTIRGGDAGVKLERASDCVVERNAIEHGKETVELARGCHRNKILDNYITLKTFGDMNWMTSSDLTRRHIVMMIKGDGRYDHHGIHMGWSGHDNEIAYNKIYQHWDGFKMYSIRGFHSMEDVEKVSRLFMRNTKFHHNIVCETWDWGIEPMGGEVNAEYHHNLLYWTQGSRIKRIGTGPAYWHNNYYACPYKGLPHIEGRLKRGRDGRFTHAPGNCFYISDQNECLLYVYHNTFAGQTSVSLGRPIKRNSKNWWFLNNLCDGETRCLSVWGGHGKDYHFHYNYLSRRGRPEWHEGYQGNVKTFRRLWEPGTPGLFRGFSIRREWPVRERGLDLSKPWTLDGVTHKPLPGLKPGYFKGKAPDIGALQYGEAMPHVGPRWRRESRR